MNPFSHDLFCFCPLHILVFDAGFFFLLHHGRRFIEAVVGSKIENENMLRRVDALRLDLLEDRMGSSVNRLVLVVHDSSGSHGRIIPEIAGEARDGGNNDDDPELSTLFARLDAGVHDSSPDGVVDWGLLLASSGDEELVFNVDKMLGVLNDLAISILDTVLGQYTTTPITATADYLCVNGALLAFGPRPIFEWRKWVIDVFSDRVFRALNRDQILVLAFSSGHGQPIDLFGTLVFVALDKVPTEDEMLGNVEDTISDKAHGDIMPGHTAVVGFAQFIGLPVLNGLEIHDAIVVEILTGEHFILDAGGMHIRTGVLAAIPTAEAQVQASDKGDLVVDDDELLVVSPVEGHVAGILEDVVVGVAQDGDVAVTGGALGTQGVKGMLGVCGVAAHGGGDFLVDDDVDLDTGLCPSLQDLIQPVFLVVKGRPSEEELGTQPPVLDVNGLFRFLQGNGYGVEVVLAVDVPFDIVAVSFRSEGFEAMTLGDAVTFVVGGFLVLFVVAMVGID